MNRGRNLWFTIRGFSFAFPWFMGPVNKLRSYITIILKISQNTKEGRWWLWMRCFMRRFFLFELYGLQFSIYEWGKKLLRLRKSGNLMWKNVKGYQFISDFKIIQILIFIIWVRQKSSVYFRFTITLFHFFVQL